MTDQKTALVISAHAADFVCTAASRLRLSGITSRRRKAANNGSSIA